MNPRRRSRAKRRNLALARTLRSCRRKPPQPAAEPAPPVAALPVRRPGQSPRRPPDDLDAHRPDVHLLRRVHAHLTDRDGPSGALPGEPPSPSQEHHARHHTPGPSRRGPDLAP